MLFDDGTGPIRDLSWLDPDGKIKSAWNEFLTWEKEGGNLYKPMHANGLGPVTSMSTPNGFVDYCSIPKFRLLKYRILCGPWFPPERCGAQNYNEEAILIAFSFGLQTRYTDTFPVSDSPKPWL